MKKLLGILVLGLLWCNVANAQTINYVCKYKATDKTINVKLNLEKNQIKIGNRVERIVYKTDTQILFIKAGTIGAYAYRVFTYAPHYSANLGQIKGWRNTRVEEVVKRLRTEKRLPVYANCNTTITKKKIKKPKEKKTVSPEVSPKLKLIEDMYKSGALTKDEYDAAKKRATE